MEFGHMPRHRLLLAAGLGYVILMNAIWMAIDTRPPFWDMAYHQSTALRILNAFSNDGLRAFLLVPRLSGGYPLLYPSLVALFYALFGTSVDAAQAVNLPAIAVLMLATYGIARRVLPPMQAAVAGVLVIFYPYMLWLSRETMIDYWLCSLVALALFTLYRTEEFSNVKRCFLFGVICGLGMLTKATFLLYVALPALWFARKNWKNAVIAGVPVISAAALRRTRLTLVLLIPLLIFQHYLVSFGIRALPEQVVLVHGTKGFFDWNWNLYTQTYFGLWGRPAREDWRIEHVLSD